MDKNKTSSGLVAGILLPIGLVCLFAFCSLALALLGGKAYKQIQTGIEDSYGSTVCSNYLLTKLSHNNELDSVFLRNEGDTQVLVISSQIQDRAFETRIFFSAGELRESLVSSDAPFKTTDGMKVADVKRCDFTIDPNGLLCAEIESVGGDITRTVFALAKGGAA